MKPKLSVRQAHSYDRQFANNYPRLYDKLDIIGFRIFVDIANPVDENWLMKIKFFSYIAYLMVGMYLSSKYEAMDEDIEEEANFEYHKLFQYEFQTKEDNSTNQTKTAEEEEREMEQ